MFACPAEEVRKKMTWLGAYFPAQEADSSPHSRRRRALPQARGSRPPRRHCSRWSQPLHKWAGLDLETADLESAAGPGALETGLEAGLGSGGRDGPSPPRAALLYLYPPSDGTKLLRPRVARRRVVVNCRVVVAGSSSPRRRRIVITAPPHRRHRCWWRRPPQEKVQGHLDWSGVVEGTW